MRSISSGSVSSHPLTVNTAALSLPAVHQSVYLVILSLHEVGQGWILALPLWQMNDHDRPRWHITSIHMAVCSCWWSTPVLPLGSATGPLRASPLQLVLLRDVSRFSQVGLAVKSSRFMALNIGQRFDIFMVLFVSDIIVAGVYILIVLLTRQSNSNVQWRRR